MDKKVIIYEEDSNIKIVHVAENINIEKYATNFLNSIILPFTVIPTNRFYRNAWSFNDTKTAVIVNMPKARTIHRDLIRAERNKHLIPLDVAYMRALERADTTAAQEIAAQKQKLRDIPAHPAIEAAQTPEELMELTLGKLLTL